MFLEERSSAAILAWLAPVDDGRLGAFEEVPVGRLDGWLTAILTPAS